MKDKSMKKLFKLLMATLTSLAMAQEVPLPSKTTWDAVDAYYTYTITGDKTFSNLEMLGANVKSSVTNEKYYLTPNACNQETLTLVLADSNNELADEFFVRLFTIKSKTDFVAYNMCSNLQPKNMRFMDMRDMMPKEFTSKINVMNDTMITKFPLYGARVKTIDQLRDSYYMTDYYVSPLMCGKPTGYLITLTRNKEIASFFRVDLMKPMSKDDFIAVEMCKMMLNHS